jgi:hypothetical protein
MEFEHITVGYFVVGPDLLSIKAGRSPHPGVLEPAGDVLVDEPGNIMDSFPMADRERPS